MNTIILGIGSNQGDRLRNIQKGVELLEKDGFEIVRISPVYETEPVGCPDDFEKFINCAMIVKSALSPHDVLSYVLKIEEKLGREHHEEISPRPIDLDILFFNSDIIDDPGLVVPHPRISERLFVLEPLAQIASGFVHPVCKLTIAEMLDKCTDSHAVKWYCNWTPVCL